MTHVTDTWYVLADGTHANPKDVAAGNDGVLCSKDGVPVALRANGLPLTSGVATKENKLAAEAATDDAGDDGKTETKGKGKATTRELKAGDDGKTYETR